jgi:hypothetical protein
MGDHPHEDHHAGGARSVQSGNLQYVPPLREARDTRSSNVEPRVGDLRSDRP